MDHFRVLRIVAVCLSCVGIVSPASAFETATPRATAAAPTPPVPMRKPAGDVELDAAGCLHGLVFGAEGLPVADVPVVLGHLGHEVARTRTDAVGRFRIGPLRGGTYQLSAAGHGRLVRVWAATTAPPGGRNVALITIGGDVVRGQMPLEEFFASDAVIICAMVAALIAVPIAVHNSGPSSP